MTDQRHRMTPPPEQPVYAISVAAELSGAAIQSIRLWEQRGLLTPHRSPWWDPPLQRKRPDPHRTHHRTGRRRGQHRRHRPHPRPEDDNTALRAQRQPGRDPDQPRQPKNGREFQDGLRCHTAAPNLCQWLLTPAQPAPCPPSSPADTAAPTWPMARSPPPRASTSVSRSAPGTRQDQVTDVLRQRYDVQRLRLSRP